MARRDRDQRISGKIIAAARSGDKTAKNDLARFVLKQSFADVRNAGMSIPASEEISQEVGLRFHRFWKPAKTKDCPGILIAFVRKLTEHSLINYFRRLAGYRALLRRLGMAGRLVVEKTGPLLEDGGAGIGNAHQPAGSGPAEGVRRGGKVGGRRNTAAGAEEWFLRLLERQDGSYEVLYHRTDLDKAHGWLLEHLFPTIADYVRGLSEVKRAVAISVWLADSEPDADGDISNQELRQIFAEDLRKLERFLYTTSDLGPYNFPSGKEVAARLGLTECRVTRLKQRITADIRELLRLRWSATMPGSTAQGTIVSKQTAGTVKRRR